MTVTQINLLILFAFIPIGIALARFILWRIDKLNGVSFTNDILPKIRENSQATAIYYGLRFIAVVYFVSALVGRFV